jgi:hypothetical protein
VGRHGHAGQAARQGGLHAARQQHGQDIAPAGAAAQRVHHAKAFAGTDKVLELVGAVAHGAVLLEDVGVEELGVVKGNQGLGILGGLRPADP